MAIKDGKDYLYLIWKCSSNRRQYIVGQLTKNGQYEFEYCKEIQAAIQAGFTPLVSFEKTDVVYKSENLFPVFASRLPDRKRKDIKKILEKYGLDEYDAYQLLKKSGAKLPIDNLQFIDPILNYKSNFEKSFYVAGVRHYLGCNGNTCENAIPVTIGDQLFCVRESDNLHDKNAICIVDKKHNRLGYVPRYYAEAFVKFIEEGRIEECHVTSVTKEAYCDECIGVLVKIADIKKH